MVGKGKRGTRKRPFLSWAPNYVIRHRIRVRHDPSSEIAYKPMEYIDTDPDQGHRFRCPAAGCHLKDKVDFSRYCDSEHYEKPEGRLRRIVGLLPRCSEEWKAEYQKRPSIERYLSSAKQSRLLDVHRCLNICKVSLHVAVSLLTYLATALARLKAGDYAGVRNMRIKLHRRGKPGRNRLRRLRFLSEERMLFHSIFSMDAALPLR